MDDIGKKILKSLEADARISYSRLGKVAGLSTPAVPERVRKMEEAGIILGYHARIKKKRAQSRVTAFIELDAACGLYDRVKQTAARISQVIECHHISGRSAFILKVKAGSVADLETVVAGFSPFGKTRTSIVLSSSKGEDQEN
ncbi:MAG: Lrp/AsnC family transcriptional regulator [Desulfobacter sp.]|nr:Lrp/AsnC family transcriptional regulator [Desulfobacter sp.]